MMDRFTEKARAALSAASEAAFLKNNPEVTPWHLVKALLEPAGGLVRALLEKMDVSPAKVSEVVDRQIQSLPAQEGAGEAYVSAQLKRVIQDAFGEAEKLKDKFVSTEHLFLALAGDRKSGVGDFLRGMGIQRENALAALQALRGSEQVVDANAEDKYQALDRFTIDLVELALKGKLDPVIGRDDEIRRVSQILSRRTKNNPVLIGDPGVGKTAIVEGLAQRIADDNVPDGLRQQETPRARHGIARRGDQVPGRVRRTVQGGSQGDTVVRRRNHPFHRRAPHARGRRRGGRIARRLQHDQAGAGPRRAQMHRGHDRR